MSAGHRNYASSFISITFLFEIIIISIFKRSVLSFPFNCELLFIHFLI